MKRGRHCELCQNEKLSLIKGRTCKLTKRKPDFDTVCSDIRFGGKLKRRLKPLENTLEENKKYRNSIYFKFVLYFLFGLLLVLWGRKLYIDYEPVSTSLTYDLHHIELSITIMSFGFVLWAVAFNSLGKHVLRKNSTKEELESIQEVLDLYKKEKGIK